MAKDKNRELVPVSFQLNNPIEKAMYEFLKGLGNKQAGPFIKQVLFSYLDRNGMFNGGVQVTPPSFQQIQQPQVEQTSEEESFVKEGDEDGVLDSGLPFDF